MDTVKPTCESFIIAAIRRLRRRSNGPADGSASGISLYRIFEVVNEIFNEEEFRRSLHSLIAADEILIVAEMYEKNGELNYGKNGAIQVTQLPPNLPEGYYRSWTINQEGSFIPGGKGECYRRVSHIKLYVIIDGLPIKASALRKSMGRIRTWATTAAEQILEDLKKQ